MIREKRKPISVPNLYAFKEDYESWIEFIRSTFKPFDNEKHWLEVKKLISQDSKFMKPIHNLLKFASKTNAPEDYLLSNPDLTPEEESAQKYRYIFNTFCKKDRKLDELVKELSFLGLECLNASNNNTFRITYKHTIPVIETSFGVVKPVVKIFGTIREALVPYYSFKDDDVEEFLKDYSRNPDAKKYSSDYRFRVELFSLSCLLHHLSKFEKDSKKETNFKKPLRPRFSGLVTGYGVTAIITENPSEIDSVLNNYQTLLGNIIGTLNNFYFGLGKPLSYENSSSLLTLKHHLNGGFIDECLPIPDGKTDFKYFRNRLQIDKL